MGLSLEIPVMSEPEKKKRITSSCWWDLLKWHIWAVLSVSGTMVLLWLNLSRYAIGDEIGNSPRQSVDIVGTLQLVIKVHELLIIASLANIGRQLIIGSLLKDGIVLGLLGAESSLSNPSFIVSGEYSQALRFGFWGSIGFGLGRSGFSRIHWKVFGLALFILWSSVISSLAGPSSAVLMIPRVDCNSFDKWTYSPPTSHGIFPNVMISVIGGPNIFDQYPRSFLGLEYWNYYFENSAWNKTIPDDLYHDFGDIGSTVFINTTGVYNRDLNQKWDGGTEVTCMMQSGYQEIRNNTWGMVPMREIAMGWRQLKTSINVNALNASITCRNRDKIPCNTTANALLSRNSSGLDWCYMSVSEKFDAPGVLRSSQNLLLAAEYADDADSRVWITEGPRIAVNQHYSDSIEVVFEGMPLSDDPQVPFNLTVGSFSGKFVSGVGTTMGLRDTPEQIQYFDYVLRHNGTTAKPPQILFHENWLDFAYSIKDPGDNESVQISPSTTPFSYPQRPGTTAPEYNLLGMFGNNTRRAGSRRNMMGIQPKALAVEVTVGGALGYLLAWTSPTNSQYSMPYDDIPPAFTEGLGGPESWLTEYAFKVYREGYVFRLSTRTGYLGCVILVLHAITAIAGSVWQLMSGKGVFLGWNNTPEYFMLGAGSAKLVEVYPNTCVAITGEKALAGVIVLERRLAGPPRIEVVSKEYADRRRTRPFVASDAKEKYE